MANPTKEDGTLAIQNAADLLERTDPQLLAALANTNTMGVATRESITNELQRRELVRLSALTRTLEGLTRWLIGWTIALFVLTVVLVFFTIVLALHESPRKVAGSVSFNAQSETEALLA
jgi:hypothetical protein